MGAYTFTTYLVRVLGLDHWQIGHVHAPRPAHPRTAPQCVGPDPLTVIQNQSLFLVESGLGLYLRRGDSPTDGHRLAAAYCEHYDPRYGTGFNGPSALRIEEIADFVLAIETYEQAGSKQPFPQS